MAEASEAMKAMARRIAWEQWPSAHDFPEREAAESAALAAIQATTERAAALNARQSGEGERLREVLVEHFPTGLRGLYEQSAQRIPVLTYVGTNCLCGWCTSATDEHEVREEWAAHVLAALRATDDAGGA